MHHVLVIKAAHDLQRGVHLANVGEELVAQSFALARTANQPGYVNEIHGGTNDFFRFADGGDFFQTDVRHRHRGLVRLDRAKGIIRRLRILRAGQRVEKGGLAHVGKTDDADAQCHDKNSCR